MKRAWKARLAASQDIDDIADYIRADNVDAAIRFIRAAKDAFDLLAQFPKAGPIRRASSSQLQGLRCWPVGGAFSAYLIFYLERSFGVEILRVVHGARDVEQIVSKLR